MYIDRYPFCHLNMTCPVILSNQFALSKIPASSFSQSSLIEKDIASVPQYHLDKVHHPSITSKAHPSSTNKTSVKLRHSIKCLFLSPPRPPLTSPTIPQDQHQHPNPTPNPLHHQQPTKPPRLIQSPSNQSTSPSPSSSPRIQQSTSN